MKGVQMRAAPDGAVTLALMGEVGWDITPAAVAEALKGARKQPVTVSLHSYGGDAMAGIAIHNMLARHDGQKTVIVEGIAASAASLIAMAGDRIVMPSNALMMIHDAWGGAVGDAAEMRQQADVLDAVSAAYRRTYAARTGKDEDEIAALMATETWFSADDALAQGFATEVAAPVEVRAMAVPDGRFSRAPAALAAFAHNPPAPPAPQEVVSMTESTPQAAAPAVPVQAPQAGPVPATLAELRQIQARAGLDAEWVLAQADAKVTLDQARDAAIDAVAAKAAVQPLHSTVTVLRDERETFRMRATAGLIARMSGERSPAPEAREFARLGLHGLMRESLAMAGERNVHRLDGSALWERMAQASGKHSTSDFPIILKDATNKRLLEYFEAINPTWRAFCREYDVSDFKTINASAIGEFPSLQQVNEGGEVTYGSLAEEGETYAVKTNGRMVALSRQAIINDDLRAFEAVIRGAGEAGARLLLDKVYGELKTNANMADGNALFSSAHFNVGAGSTGTVYHYLVTPDRPTVEVSYLEGRRAPEVVGDEDFSVLGISYRVVFDIGVKAVSWRGMARERAAVSETTVAALEKLLMEQKSVSGNFLAPAQRLVLLVPPSEFVAARKLATSITPDSSSNVNVYGGRLSVIEEPRLA